MASAIRAFLCRKICTFVYWCEYSCIYDFFILKNSHLDLILDIGETL